MPHKDRATRLAYLARYRAAHRPAPQPGAQHDDGLPPRGIIKFSDDGTQVRCHCCGRWFRGLNNHLRTHGLNAAMYKEMYDIARGASLWPPAYQAKQREAALARGQGDIGREVLAAMPANPRVAGIKHRLSVRIDASKQRAGINMRAGKRTRDE